MEVVSGEHTISRSLIGRKGKDVIFDSPGLPLPVSYFLEQQGYGLSPDDFPPTHQPAAPVWYGNKIMDKYIGPQGTQLQ